MSQGSAISFALETMGSCAMAGEQRRVRVEAVVAAAERSGEIEAEAVDAAIESSSAAAPPASSRH